MTTRILYVERKPGEFVSLEKAFRQIAEALPAEFATEFQQAPYGTRFKDSILNLILYRRRPADIYHVTGHINYIALRFQRRNTILSIMDLRILKAKGRLRRFVLKKLYLDLPVKHLKYITAISEQIRQEVIENTDCAPEKVRALDLPLLDHLGHAEMRDFNAACPLILQVGTMPNKNVPRLAAALKGIECRLRVVGRLSEDQVEALEWNNIEFENLTDLSDEEMRNQYAAADIIAFCSTYEGFGLPIIEGQAMGRPVITSDLSPMRETAGRAACLIDPTDVDSIRAGILKIIQDGNYRADLIEKGFKNVERFKPERVARQYAELYEEVLANL